MKPHQMKNIILLLALLGTFTLSAQNWEKTRYGTIDFQYQQVDFADFNKQAEALGYPQLGESMLDISGGVTRHSGAWKTYFFFGLGLTEENAPNNGPETRYQYAGAGWSTSYNVLNPTSSWFVGPEVQVLFRGEQLILADQGQASNLTSAVGTGYAKLTRFSTPVDLGINIHNAIKLSANNPNFIVLGLRVGYRLETDTGWQIDQAVDIEETGIVPGGLYAGLRIGFRFY
jgi:hypothetical protein